MSEAFRAAARGQPTLHPSLRVAFVRHVSERWPAREAVMRLRQADTGSACRAS